MHVGVNKTIFSTFRKVMCCVKCACGRMGVCESVCVCVGVCVCVCVCVYECVRMCVIMNV